MFEEPEIKILPEDPNCSSCSTLKQKLSKFLQEQAWRNKAVPVQRRLKINLSNIKKRLCKSCCTCGVIHPCSKP